MKKLMNTLMLLAMLLLPCSAHAVQQGATNFVGNVGIGTSVPSAALQVVGKLVLGNLGIPLDTVTVQTNYLGNGGITNNYNVVASPALDVNGTFTVEMKFNLTADLNGNNYFLSQANLLNPTGVAITYSYVSPGVYTFGCQLNSGGGYPGPGGSAGQQETVTLNANHHIACEGDGGGDIYLYLDGIQIASGVLGNSGSGTTVGNNQNVYIGAQDNGGTVTPAFLGNMAEVRISNVERWSSNFTPPTSPYTSDSNTVLLLHLNDSTADSSSNNLPTTNNNVTFSNSSPFFGSDYYGVFNPSSSSSLYTQIPPLTVTGSPYYNLSVNGSEAGFIGINGLDSYNLEFGTGTTPQLFLTTAGNFGVGVSSPLYNFDVNGILGNSTAGYFFDCCGDLVTPGTIFANGAISSSGGGFSGLGLYIISGSTPGANSANIFAVTDANNETGEQFQDVEQGFYSNVYATAESTGVIAQVGDVLQVNNINSGVPYIYQVNTYATPASSIFTYAGIGNVGIGTSASNSKMLMYDSNGVLWHCGPAVTTGVYTCS